jgi:hypothetical protein
MMSGSIEKMEFSDKEQMMEQMMPHMMANMTFEDKMNMMRKMMPLMMADVKPDEMERMMDTMMPIMMNVMQDKGVKPLQMMRLMCPKCISFATSDASAKDKKELKSEMSKLFTVL